MRKPRRITNERALAAALGLSFLLTACSQAGGSQAGGSANSGLHVLHIAVADNVLPGTSDPFTNGPLQLTVENQNGTIIAEDSNFDSPFASGVGTTFYATVRVPTESFYKIQIQRVGSYTFSLHTAESDQWHIQMTYGG